MRYFIVLKERGSSLEKEEIKLTEGKVFIVPSGTMHALRTDSNLWVCSFLIPVLCEGI